MRGLWTLVVLAGVAMAEEDERPPNAVEAGGVTTALAKIGCRGGKVSVRGDRFRVDNATCGDDEPHDFVLDSSYAILNGRRPATAEESRHVQAALVEHHCSGTDVVFDYRSSMFVVDRAVCENAGYRDVVLDKDFKVIGHAGDEFTELDTWDRFNLDPVGTLADPEIQPP